MVHSESMNSSDSSSIDSWHGPGTESLARKRAFSVPGVEDALTREEGARKRLRQAQTGWQAVSATVAASNRANQTQLAKANSADVLESIRLGEAQPELVKVRKDPAAEWEAKVELAKVRKDPVTEWEAKVELAKVRKDPVGEWKAEVELAKVRKDPVREWEAKVELAKVRKDPVGEWKAEVELAKVRKDPVAEWEAKVELAKVRKDPVGEWEAKVELAKVRKDPVGEWEAKVELAKVRKDPVGEWKAEVELAKVRTDPVAEWEAKLSLAKVRKERESIWIARGELAKLRNDSDTEAKAKVELMATYLSDDSEGQTISEGRMPQPRQTQRVLLQSPQNQGAVSTYSKPVWKTLKGFAYLPRTVQFDPTPGGRVFKSVLPSAWCNSTKIPVIGDGPQLMALGETKHIKPRFHQFMTLWGVSGETNLTTRRGFGGGKVDGCILRGDRKGGLLEIKGGEFSLAGGKREASVYGSTVAMDHLASGVAVKDILVPMVVYNGQLMQFCATFMLEPSMPVFMAVSEQFNLDNLEQNEVASRFWCRFIETANSFAPTTCRPQDNFPLQLNPDQYWIKNLTEDVLARGLGMFAGDGDYEYRVAAGLEHMILPLNALYRHVPARNVTVFPLCVMSPGTQDVRDGVECSNVLLVYPDMSLEGFAIGIPDHNDKGTFNMYISALDHAVAAVHEAGVVHMDLYVSNIMHRVKDGQVEIKIIDWDAAHLIGEEFNGRIREGLRRRHGNKAETIDGVDHDLTYVNALKKAGRADIWQNLRVGNAKEKMDAAFFDLMLERE